MEKLVVVDGGIALGDCLLEKRFYSIKYDLDIFTVDVIVIAKTAAARTAAPTNIGKIQQILREETLTANTTQAFIADVSEERYLTGAISYFICTVEVHEIKSATYYVPDV